MTSLNPTIRPCLATDLNAVTALDVNINAAHPITAMAFRTPEDTFKVFLHRFTYFLSNPIYHFLVATLPSGKGEDENGEEEIVGFVVWKEGGNGKEEWEPELTEDTDGEVLGVYMGSTGKDKANITNGELAGMYFSFYFKL